MNSPVIRYVMATLFTVVCTLVTFVVAALVLGSLIGQVGMMVVLLLSTVGYWLWAQHLFNVLGDKK